MKKKGLSENWMLLTCEFLQIEWFNLILNQDLTRIYVCTEFDKIVLKFYRKAKHLKYPT